MKKFLFNLFKWVVFIPLSIIIPGIICFGISYLTKYLLSLDLSVFIIIVFLFIGVGAIFTLPIIISQLLSLLVSSIAPNFKVGNIIFAITSISLYVFLIFYIWIVPDQYPFATILILLIMTALVISVGGSTISAIQEEI